MRATVCELLKPHPAKNKPDESGEFRAPRLPRRALMHVQRKGENTMDMEILNRAPEQKAGVPAEPYCTHEDVQRIFESYKQENETRLAEVAKGKRDPLTEEKMTRMDARIDSLTVKSARPALASERKDSPEAREHKAAFDEYVRRGESGNLRTLETKAMSVASNPDGGYTVPFEIEKAIGERVTAISPIRRIAGVREISGNVYKKPFMTTGPAVGWVGETDARGQTASATLDSLSFPAMELYAMPAATGTLLEDSAVNIDEWLAGEVEQVFAQQEGAAFVNGDGTNKPKGFLQYTTIANASWSWGNIGYIASGAAGAFPASNPSDVLVDLIYAVKAGYRQNGVFVMNRKTQAAIRKFKDGQGNYLWQPPAQANGSATLMTFPIVEAEDMPDIAANSLSIAFGDFRRGYLVVDRQGLRVLRDPFTAKPYVLFYTTKRVGGGVQDFDAIKLLKFAAS
jgi:HK97 family phage major capsid protein